MGLRSRKGEAGRRLGAFLAGPFAVFGKSAIRWIAVSGAAVIFFLRAALKMFRPKQFPKIVQQVYYIGARSCPIILLVGLFTGMVLGLQMSSALVRVGGQGYLGTIVALALVRELGPVLAAIMITARAGSAIAAEIGIQRISEQVDALATMHIDPVRYLVSPRLAAALISFPVLTALFDLIGIVGGYVSGVTIMGANSGTYVFRVQSSLEMKDIVHGFIKAGVFAVVVSTVCCFQGYFAHMRKDSHGTKAVALSTTSGVVLSCILILLSDYIVTSFLI